MPVWHEATRALRESGRLTVLGITQEQHAARCQLFVQWHQIDWPVLWDPFNMTGSQVVPRFTLIDESGIVRSTSASLETLENSFLAQEFPAATAPELPAGGGRELIQALTTPPGSPVRSYYQALGGFIWQRGQGDWRSPLIAVLDAYARENEQDPAARWRLGVAYRMRHDSAERQAGDFQAALDHWAEGLSLNPGQYIYRRRLQQYGPRLDKPYPFYDWVAQAQAAIVARAESFVVLDVPLSGAECSPPAVSKDSAPTDVEPDPKSAIASQVGALEVESAVARHTTADKGSAVRVHLNLRLTSGSGLAFDAEAGPLAVWLHSDPACVPPQQLIYALADGTAPILLDFEVAVLTTSEAPALRGYVLYHACSARSGECMVLRHDFRVALPRAP